MKKNQALFLFLFFMLLGLLSSCQDEASFDIQQVDIQAVDQINVPVGTYVIPYTIDDLSNLVKTYHVEVTISVIDKDDQTVNIQGSTIEVDIDQTYTVTIRVTLPSGEFKEKTIRIDAVLSSSIFYDVSFELNQGNGQMDQQEVVYGGLVNEPETLPTKEGFVFAGWYSDEALTSLYDFDLPLYQSLTLYAKWDEVTVEITWTVNYDLNGAFQSEAITESVLNDSYAQGLAIDPVWSGYTFLGWSTTAEEQVIIDLSTYTIQENITFYAVWEFQILSIINNIYFETPSITLNANLSDIGEIEQNYEIFYVFNGRSFETDFETDETVLGYGFMINQDENEVDDQGLNVVKMEQAYTGNTSTLLAHRADTYPLDELTTYYIRYFVRYESMIVYSEIETIETYDVIPEGTSYGTTGLLSGGFYHVGDGNPNFRPAFWYGVEDGYEANDNGYIYGSYDDLYHGGIHQVLIKDLTTGIQSLLVYHLTLVRPHVNSIFYTETQDGSGYDFTYRLTLPFEDEIGTYHFDDLGILVSTEHPYLYIGLPDVQKRDADLDSSGDYMESDETYYPGSHDQFYVRGYVIIDDVITYSDVITVFEYNDTIDQYIKSQSITIREERAVPEIGVGVGIGTGVSYELITLQNGIFTASTDDQYRTINEVGRYFILTEESSIFSYEIYDTYPVVEGVEDGQTYQEAVWITFDMANPYWYVKFEQGEYVALPSQIRLGVIGSYEILYYTPYGWESLYFTITK